jgi:hypothetical protein
MLLFVVAVSAIAAGLATHQPDMSRIGALLLAVWLIVDVLAALNRNR